MDIEYLIKHRNDRDIFEMNLSRWLGVGETIATVPSVRVMRNRGLDWEDVTSAFVDSTPATLVDGGRTVQYTLKAASGSGQKVGEYMVSISCTTTEGRLRLTTSPLFIISSGS